MRNIAIVFALCFCFVAKAQNTISGTFSPAKDFSWLIAYRLKPGTQVYVADTAIENGNFSLELPKSSPKGTYRLVYAVPQEEFYIDVIYNGNELINFNFNIEEGVVFTSSNENILFSTYFKEINDNERDLISFYSKGSTDSKAFNKHIKKFKETQIAFENKSENLIVNQFIKANKPYIPKEYESIQNYVQNRKKLYFNNLDITNSVLQASGFLTDKIANYVFTALPLENIVKAETEKEMQSNIVTVVDNLKEVSDTYQFHILYSLWTQCSASNFNTTADFIFSKYLKTSNVAAANKDIIQKIETHSRLRLGAIAPEISWQNKKLSALNGAKNYLLVFWSSTCGHCLKELPALHKEIGDNKDVKVVAVGLEDNDTYWDIESSKLANFEHVISLGKWESNYAKLFDIQATPTYFILDENKRIIAKPETDKEVVSFLKSEKRL